MLKRKNDDQSKKPFIGSGIHTTIMPSPGGIPGKYSFECEGYIEKLVFNQVPGGVRNRGGGNEQFPHANFIGAPAASGCPYHKG